MDKKGDFSKNLFSLQLQLKTLLEDAGGDNALQLLDALCKLSRSEQQIALRIFKRTIDKIAAGDTRLETESDKELADFEENLFDGLLSDIREKLYKTRTGKRLSVLDGGKAEPSPGRPPVEQNGGIIDFETARKNKLGLVTKPIIN